jgi:ribosomal protein S8
MLVFFNYIGAAPVIRDIFLVSRPGRRVFWNLRKFQKIVSKSSYGGFYILSTPYGITPHDDCLIGIRKSKYAGEVLLKVIYNTARQKPTILCR